MPFAASLWHKDRWLPCRKAWKYLPVDGAEEPEQGLGSVHGEDDDLDGVWLGLLHGGEVGEVGPGERLLAGGAGEGQVWREGHTPSPS